MKSHERLVIPIKSVKRRREGEQGSIVLEAALVMPLLLIVLVFFIVLIRLCAVQLAVQSAASQTVRQIASHIRPAELAFQQVSDKLPDELLEPAQEELSDWSSIAAEAAEWLPDPAGSIASAALQGDWQPLENMAATELGRSVVEPVLKEYADSAMLDADLLRLSSLTLPDLKNKEEPYLTIAVEYEFPFRLPFVDQPFVLKEQASERVWVSDPLPATSEAEGDEDTVPIQIISIQPSPLRPGRKATVVALTDPGASASLSVKYKSGQSVAKNLGQAVADTNGTVSWTWLVGGNTTQGIWELTAVSSSGEQVSKHFIVEKNGDEGS